MFFDPTQEAEIKRRRRLAEQLQKQSAPQQTQVVSGFAVPQSGFQGLAQALGQGVSTYQDLTADQKEQELAKQRQELLAQALGSNNKQEAAKILGQDPEMAGSAVKMAFPDSSSLGGATGAIADRLIAQGVDPLQAVLIAKSGLGTGRTFDTQSGMVRPMAGAPEAGGAIKRGEAMGGAIGKAEGEAQGAIGTSQINAPKMQELIGQAQKLLPQASSGLTGRVGAGLKGTIGYSDEATKADRQLEVISAALTGNVPRFEGPQGVLDVQLYKQAAGDVANRAIPRADRLAALKTIEDLNAKYLQGGSMGPTANIPNRADPLAAARDAIAKGAPRDAVIQRLQQNGIDATGL